MDFTVATIAQLLYAHRIHILSRKVWLSAIIIFVRSTDLLSRLLLIIACIVAIRTTVICWHPECCLHQHECILYVHSNSSNRVDCVYCVSGKPLSSFPHPVSCDITSEFSKAWGPINVACDLTITISMVILVGTDFRASKHTHIR